MLEHGEPTEAFCTDNVLRPDGSVETDPATEGDNMVCPCGGRWRVICGDHSHGYRLACHGCSDTAEIPAERSGELAECSACGGLYHTPEAYWRGASYLCPKCIPEYAPWDAWTEADFADEWGDYV